MKQCFSILAAGLFLAACSEKPGYEITGTVSNAEANGKYIYLYDAPFRGSNTPAVDSALVTNQSFTFKGVADTAQVKTLVLPAKEGERPAKVNLILENAKLSATFGEKETTVSGTAENDELTAYNKQVAAIYAGAEALMADLRSADKDKAEAAGKKFEEMEQQANALRKQYMTNHLNHLSGALLLAESYYFLDDATLFSITDNAGEVFKKFPGMDRIMKTAEIKKKVAVGQKFTDFEMADLKGKMHKLSEYVGNGKVVLVDFWASWCGPCRRSMPELIEIYNRNKAAGFDVIGISLDNKKDAWEKGIKDLNLPWPQLSDLQGWKCAGAALYGINSIPHTVLVGKDGTIIAKNLHGQELEDKIKEALK